MGLSSTWFLTIPNGTGQQASPLPLLQGAQQFPTKLPEAEERFQMGE